jgi:flagellar motor switch protein FliN/FliY
MSTLDHIEVDIIVELGATNMPVHHLLRMGRGAVIELDATEHDPLSIYANNTCRGRAPPCAGDGKSFPRRLRNRQSQRRGQPALKGRESRPRAKLSTGEKRNYDLTA